MILALLHQMSQIFNQTTEISNVKAIACESPNNISYFGNTLILKFLLKSYNVCIHTRTCTLYIYTHIYREKHN